MVAKGTPLPRRIEPDAIVEAVFEVRFDAVKPLPEVLFGRLAELAPWRGFTQRNLPAYQLPSMLRDSDPNLRFVPVFELAGTGPQRVVRIGAHVISYHQMQPYAGWLAFSQGLDVAIDGLFATTEGLAVRRLGLRYINSFTQARHGVGSVADLDLAMSVAGVALTANLNLNFTADVAAGTQCRVSVATREYVQGLLADGSLAADVDVFTVEGFQVNSVEAVKQWAAEAHIAKNEAFFSLLQPATLTRLGRDM